MKFAHYFSFLCSFLISATLFAQGPQLVLEEYAGNFTRAVDIQNAGDDRLFIVEQAGRIRIIDGNGSILPGNFLNITSIVNDNGFEQGLLGLAFHPNYVNNGFYYVNYTAGSGSGETRISRFQVDPDDVNSTLAGSEQIILTVEQPATNHNAGAIAFGPDGYLYIGLGDGGQGGDPWGNSQNPEVLLGKMLRIDVDGGASYVIPTDNPFVDSTNIRDEIWALGLRNPWRFSFDRIEGNLWIGDVGQDAIEEINFQPANSPGGENYGWDCFEGSNTFNQPADECAMNPVVVDPVFEYGQSTPNGCSVTGGYVYRGCDYPHLLGYYILADYCSGRFWTIVQDGLIWDGEQALDSGRSISTFGEDHEGEIYVAAFNGKIYKVNSVEDFTLTIEGLGMFNIVEGASFFDSFQWFNFGQPIAGATEPSYDGSSEDGEYYVVATTNNGECSFQSNTIMYNTSGVKEIQGLTHFVVQPNPFSDFINIEIAIEHSTDLQIRILDISGKIIAKKQFTNQTAFNTNFNLSALTSGIYIVELQSDSGLATQKIVK